MQYETTGQSRCLLTNMTRDKTRDKTQDKTRQDKTFFFSINRSLQRPVYTVGQAVVHIYRT